MKCLIMIKLCVRMHALICKYHFRVWFYHLVFSFHMTKYQCTGTYRKTSGCFIMNDTFWGGDFIMNDTFWGGFYHERYFLRGEGYHVRCFLGGRAKLINPLLVPTVICFCTVCKSRIRIKTRKLATFQNLRMINNRTAWRTLICYWWHFRQGSITTPKNLGKFIKYWKGQWKYL